MPAYKPVAAGVFGQPSAYAAVCSLAAHAARLDGQDMAARFASLMAGTPQPSRMAA